jgi:hypothetical protein
MFGERPKFDDALGKVAVIIRTEQGLIATTELLEYFWNKHPTMLIKEFDLYILLIACYDQHDYEEMFSTAQEIENFGNKQRRRRGINYKAKLYLDYESENND